MKARALAGGGETVKADATIRVALLSVSDKQGVVPFAQFLHARGIRLLSTGGTADLLQRENVPVMTVSAHTGAPEMMGGRVKTLHPIIHGGILARPGVDDAVLRDNGIRSIEMVVVNLYPFEAVTAHADCTWENAIEHIDIGGATLLRAAAKNHVKVTTVVDPADYDAVIRAMSACAPQQAATPFALRAALARKAFAHTARYDATVHAYFDRHRGKAEPVAGESRAQDPDPDPDQPHFPHRLTLSYRRGRRLRYGENPHQRAAFYLADNAQPDAVSWSSMAVLQGKPLSYNNIADADAAWRCVRDIAVRAGETVCVIVKHMNPCGVAVHTDPVVAYQAAFGADSLSAFGGIIAFNAPVSAVLAEKITQTQFAEVILAPDFSQAARAHLASKPGWRLLQTPTAVPYDDHRDNSVASAAWDCRTVMGGLLVQEQDQGQGADLSGWQWVGTQAVVPFSAQSSGLNTAQVADLQFAWSLVKNVKSNAIVFAKDRMTLGIGAGQMSRIDSVHIALRKAAQAQRVIQGAVMASDAFFPFRDCIDEAARAGVQCIIHPGGSKNDAAVIAAARETGVGMVLTGRRHFYH